MTNERLQAIEQIKSGDKWDLIVVGGGILGAGIYAYAAQLGLKVLLLEQKDFAWGSSSKSSKMVHGGLRYISQGQIGLTKESVEERQKLLECGQGLVEPANYVMSHYKGQFPSKGLFGLLMHIYGFFAGGRQHKSLSKVDYQMLSPGCNPFGVKGGALTGGTQYTDALTDDARLVYRLIQQGNLLSGVSLNYCKVIGLLREAERVTGVRAKFDDAFASDASDSKELKELKELQIPAKLVVNASGAWSDQLDSQVLLRPLRGSHILVPQWRLPVFNVVTLLHPRDKRPVMIYPWQNTTLIGTTDIDHSDSLSKEPKMTADELEYIFELVKAEFPAAKLTKDDVISSYAGVRPIVLDKPLNKEVSASDEKRTHSVFEQAGLFTVCGGKLTTFRVIAEEVLQKSTKSLGLSTPLPPFEIFANANEQELESHYYLAGRYGAKVSEYLQEFAQGVNDNLWHQIRHAPTIWLELVIAAKYEQVHHLDDLLLRRTRLGNVLPQGGIDILDEVEQLCSPYLAWDKARWQQERERYLQIWQAYYSLPQDMPQKVPQDV